MPQPVNQNNFTHYTDSSNAKRSVRHSVISDAIQSEDAKSRIAEDIFKVFMRNQIKS